MIQLWLLLLGHFVADFALQSDSMARGKNRHRKPENVPPGQRPMVVWPYWLSAHAGTHSAAVYLVTGSVYLSVAEFAAHCFIDFAKCENWTTIHADQGLHMASKVLWVLL